MVYDEDPTIPPLSVRAAANRLGFSTWGVYKAIDRGELKPVTKNPVQVLASDVEALRSRKQDEAIARIGADRLLKLAEDVRVQLHPPVTAAGRRGHAALELISETVKSALTMPLLHAAAMPDGSGCRWCAAEVAGRMLGIPVSAKLLKSQIGLALLGGPGCEKHRAFVAGRMRELGARVHPGVERSAGGRAEAVAPAPVVARSRPAQPVQDDNGGRALVASRLREVRARAKVAKRSGDQAYALPLAQMARDLEKDAAVVDGGVRKTAGPAGTKACGVAVGVRCRCHPNDYYARRRPQ